MADFIRVAGNPVPPGGDAIDFRAEDGAHLRGAVFCAQNHRATAVLMTGRSEFIEKYFEVIADLQRRGISTAVMDWRGQGLSERALPDSKRGHVEDFSFYRSDLRQFTEGVAKKRFSGPYLLMTHSMGGAPGLQLLASGYAGFSGAVLSAPMTRLFPDPAKRGLARTLAGAVCAFGGSNLPVLGVKEHSLEFLGNDLTSDRERHARFRTLQEAAPEAAIREPTYQWLRAAIDAMDDLHKPDRFRNLETPVLIVSAEFDMLVNTADHQTLADRSPLISAVTIRGALHEIMMERDELRNQYWDHFDKFVEPILAKATAAA